MKNFKRIIAFGMTMIMMAGSSLTAFAAEDTESDEYEWKTSEDGTPEGTTGIEGKGSIEGLVPNDVVIVKVSAQKNGDYKLILDPQRLIYESVFNDIKDTSREEYKAEYFESATDIDEVPTAYFKKYARTIKEAGVVSADNATPYKYTNTSTPLYAINKGLNNVNVGLKASVKLTDPITVSADKAWPDSTFTEPAIYVGVKSVAITGSLTGDASIDELDAVDAVAIRNDAVADAEGVKFVRSFTEIAKNELGAAPLQNTGNVSVSYNQTTDSYHLIQAANDKFFKSVGFELEAAANPNGVWKKEYIGKAPDVELTWDFSVKSAATVNITSAGVITVSGLTGAQNFTKMNIYSEDGFEAEEFNTLLAAECWNTDNWTAENGGTVIVTFPTDWVKWFVDRGKVTVEVVMNDGSTATGSATITE